MYGIHHKQRHGSLKIRLSQALCVRLAMSFFAVSSRSFCRDLSVLHLLRHPTKDAEKSSHYTSRHFSFVPPGSEV
jgi:hypothetical protein